MTISGLKFPLQVSSLGRFALSQDGDKFRQNLQCIASTALRERWYEPNMGTVGYQLLFRNVANSQSEIVNLLKTAFAQQEPRVVIRGVRTELDDEGSGLHVIVTYIRKDIQVIEVFDFELEGL